MFLTLLAGEGPISPAEIVNELFPNLWIFIAHLIATILLLVLLTKWLYNPFRKAMRARRKFIQDTIDDAVTKQSKANIYKNQAIEMLNSAKTEAGVIVASARQEAENKKMEILEVAQKEVSNLNQHAKLAIAKEREQSEDDIRRSIIQLAMDAAGKIMETNMNEKSNEKLVEDFIDNLK